MTVTCSAARLRKGDKINGFAVTDVGPGSSGHTFTIYFDDGHTMVASANDRLLVVRED